ncbi:AfaD family invasin [Serratia marcescens]|uniref:AfaD family invasin n=1 Tax=Serratia marcescens TaxID=615 RepID=UPI0024C4AB87|nr:AfaD family invasin [Serratia marcescens]MDK1711727.1 AfaD family invasin [Serratia marcescens]
MFGRYQWGWGVGLVLWAGFACASDVPHIVLKQGQTRLAGFIADGTRIAQGRISSEDAHAGFRVYGAGKTMGAPGHYVLQGTQEARHVLRIRLEHEGWLADSEGGEGIHLLTADRSAEFYVVADGDQMVTADRYSLAVSGSILLDQ